MAELSATAAIHSALACCQLLLQLTQERAPQAADPGTERDLRRALKDYARGAGADLRLERLALARLTPKMLPLIWRDRSGAFILLARLSDAQALIQRPSAHTPDVIDRAQLAEEWSGEVIRLRQGGLRFDLSWFVPELLRHRRILGEVLLCSLLLQVLALATPLFFQAVMDKVMVHRALSTLDVLVMTLVVVGLFEVLLKGLREYLRRTPPIASISAWGSSCSAICSACRCCTSSSARSARSSPGSRSWTASASSSPAPC